MHLQIQHDVLLSHIATWTWMAPMSSIRPLPWSMASIGRPCWICQHKMVSLSTFYDVQHNRHSIYSRWGCISILLSVGCVNNLVCIEPWVDYVITRVKHIDGAVQCNGRLGLVVVVDTRFFTHSTKLEYTEVFQYLWRLEEEIEGARRDGGGMRK